MSRVTCHVSRVTCHVSRVTCHVSHVTCHLSHVICHDVFFFGKGLELVGGGSIINGAYPVSFMKASLTSCSHLFTGLWVYDNCFDEVLIGKELRKLTLEQRSSQL